MPELTWPLSKEALIERREVAAGRLPERYADPWERPFLDLLSEALRPGSRVLDVGSGARPTVPPEQRPDGCHYVGLDASGHELARAPAGSYDETSVGDIVRPPELGEPFDLVVSWQVLEHVASMRRALESQRRALVPGGHLVAQLSGARAIHAVLSRAVPHRLATALMARLMGESPEDHFPTHYDGCTHTDLQRFLAEGGWSHFRVIDRYKAGGYLRFSRPLQRAYLAYENLIARGGRPDLATHYLIHAVR